MQTMSVAIAKHEATESSITQQSHPGQQSIMEPKSLGKRVKSFGVDISDIMAEASDNSGLTKRGKEEQELPVSTLEQPTSKNTNGSKRTALLN